MKYYSTNDINNEVDYRQTLNFGQAKDGGLFLPVHIPDFSLQLEEIQDLSLGKKAEKLLFPFISDVPQLDFEEICQKSFDFPVITSNLKNNLVIAELFHGPTFAFKDFGAKFLANLLGYFLKKENRMCTILVATSGDTGGAVARAFHNLENTRVVLLFPSKKISLLQEKQLTTIGDNVFAFEVLGDFDDCQGLVKKAFLDSELRDEFQLTSANSINFTRLLAQTIYYFESVSQLKADSAKIRFIVPSGNLGNLTAGLIAKKMGLPIDSFISALNSNMSFYNFIKTGNFLKEKTKKTISNAMDVGNPSNILRIINLFENDIKQIRKVISAFSIEDSVTTSSIREVYDEFNYIMDPHTAVGYAASKLADSSEYYNIILSTAHPAKFHDIVAEIVGAASIQFPTELSELLNQKSMSSLISADYNHFRKSLKEILR